MLLKKYFLLLCAVTVIVIGLLYGVSPDWFSQHFYAVNALDINFKHMLRAITGLYVGFGVFLFISANSDKHRDTALLSAIFFAGGIFLGRMFSFVLDGRASDLLSFYALLEVGLIPVAIWIYKLPD